MNKQTNSMTSIDLRKKIELFLSYWKIIVLCVIVAIALAFIHLRYATYEYSAKATIQIKDEEESKKISGIEGINGSGLFSDGTNKIKDEIAILTSRTLVKNVVKKLNLNIRYFQQGKIIESEIYQNPPLKLSFFESDSIINKIDTTFYIKIKNATDFLMFNEGSNSFGNRNNEDGILYSFGNKIDTGFGGMVITPNIGKNAPVIGSDYKITMTSIGTLVNGYRKGIIVSTAEGSSIVKLELNQSNAKKAIDVLNALIQEYNNDVLLDKEKVIEITSDFINSRLAKVSEELEQVDFTAEQLQKNNRLTALDAQADLYLQSERNNEAQILETSNKLQLIDFLQEEVDNEAKASDLLPLNVIQDQNVAQVTKTYNDLVAQRDRILKNSSEKNPIVIQLNDEINAQKNSLRNTLSKMKESNLITLKTLKDEDSRIRGQIYTAPTKQRKFRDIERQQGIKESLYLYLLEKREETNIRLGMYSPNAKIVDKAYSSGIPIAPNKNFTYLASILLGLILPLGFIYLTDLINTKIYRKDELINLIPVPYLGDIPKTSGAKKTINKIDYSPKAESFRIIRSNIDFVLKDVENRAKKIFITSTKAQEGKSHTSTNLASSISFSEKSVLLIETDIRMPKIMDYMGLENKSTKGLSDYIVDKSIKPQEIIVKHKGNQFLDIIPSGTIPPNPSELLMNERVKNLFEYFENKYDYIVVDTSAVGLVSDTLLIADFADMFIYVVSAGNIDKRLLEHVATPLYEKNRLPRMMMLLNGVVKAKQGYGYGYGYGYGNPEKNNKKWYQFWA